MPPLFRTARARAVSVGCLALGWGPLSACSGETAPPAPPGRAAVTLDAASVAACHRPLVAAVPEDGPDGVAAVHTALRTHDAVLVGEHHGDVAEIDFLVDVIDALDHPTLLAMELVPATAQNVVDRALSAPTLPAEAWPAVVGDRYWPAPFHVAEYARVFQAAHAARQRGVEVRVLGLSPDCRLPSAPTAADRAAAISCFRTRDTAMLDRLRDFRAQHTDHSLLISAGWRHLAAVRLPDAPSTLGLELPAHWSTHRVLLAGSEPAQPDGSRTATCGGTPQALAVAAGGAVALRADQTPWTVSDCVDTAAPLPRPLSAAFDQVIGLPPAPAPTPWDAAAFSAVSLDDRAAWSRVRRVLMDQPTPSASPDALAVWAADDVAQLSASHAARRVDCGD